MNPTVTIEMENGNTIVAELYPEKAPQTVANFIYLANEENLYDNLVFHRVIPGFMVQGGDPKGNGTGGPGYCIAGEFAANRFAANDISHEPGVLSMARAMPFNSGGSQFFICVARCAFLDGQYAGFGKVTQGLSHAIEISETPRNAQDCPLTPQKIKSIRVQLNGYTPEPLQKL